MCLLLSFTSGTFVFEAAMLSQHVLIMCFLQIHSEILSLAVAEQWASEGCMLDDASSPVFSSSLFLILLGSCHAFIAICVLEKVLFGKIQRPNRHDSHHGLLRWNVKKSWYFQRQTKNVLIHMYAYCLDWSSHALYERSWNLVSTQRQRQRQRDTERQKKK